MTAHVEMIEQHAEAFAAAERLRQLVYSPSEASIVSIAAEINALTKVIAESMRAANEIASRSEYVAPEIVVDAEVTT